MRTALVVGGTGPTGPHIVAGLVARGFETAIFHRGTHEVDDLPPVEHIHGDPHHPETIAEALGGREFDVVIAAYGRIRHLADSLAGRCDQFISIGGIPAYRGYWEPQSNFPTGMKLLADEASPVVEDIGQATATTLRMSWLIRQTEKAVMAHHARGSFRATHYRYPSIYGPRQLAVTEWAVVRRVLDGRRRMIVSDGGHSIFSRQAARNAAHAVLLAVDKPDAAAGEIFNCADEDQFTQRQWIELTARLMGADLEIVSLPDRHCGPARAAFPLQRESGHALVDISRIRRLLGYRDLVAPRDALAEATGWYRRNAEELRASKEIFLVDPFDYAREDRLIEAWQRAFAAVEREVSFPLAEPHHPYPHPKKAGSARDERER